MKLQGKVAKGVIPSVLLVSFWASADGWHDRSTSSNNVPANKRETAVEFRKGDSSSQTRAGFRVSFSFAGEYDLRHL